MSEYGLSSVSTRNALPNQFVPQQSGAGVEWYSVSGTQQQYGAYQYDQNVATNSGATYGTFEDEAPLLEGEYCIPLVSARVVDCFSECVIVTL